MTEPLHTLPMNDPRNERLRKAVASAPVVHEGWPWQCRCGTMKVVRYHGFRCGRCGSPWKTNPRTGEGLASRRDER